MDWGLALLLAGLLGLLLGQSLQVKPLQVEPPEPVVAVALGASRQLTCRLTCADRGAAVQWRGLDTSLGAVQSDTGRSVLTVRNASLSAAGTRVCVGSCWGRTFQHTVQLLVYAFPDQLTVSPAVLAPGDPEVACTAHKVTPGDPNALSFSLLLGGQELEGAQALGPEMEEEEPQEDEDVLFRVTERWRLPPLGTPVPPALYCQATMRLPGLELSHRQAIPASKPAGDQLPTALWTSSVVLGLLLLALLTYHLWKHCRHLAEDGAHPPASLRFLPQVSAWAGLRGTGQVGISPS
ncbi:mucosal addressin cell adhesion molecule 1 isoform X3 [Symphalangus syndactylus]|uniref:mucosal addressin cell adhesion molecule 1 isoform X3 n=1 Tax=Symphalangus syndactylus TaxID=9590 RepID=UPI0024431EDB|nr:mucosal addressin cell adhesion molecule 1 isoform X3 [Symphalangus syndactylus]XP_055103773.1 mucosal addressin cell adhesion molecule 1 isoform X2 [Symphalangus syndactylus]